MRHFGKFVLGALLATFQLCAGPVQELSQSNFNSTIQANRFVIVDVYSQRCGACKQLEPVYEKLNSSYGSQYIFTKLNAPRNVALSDQLRIQAYPTIIFFKDGKEVARTIGFTSGDDLLKTAQANFTAS